MYSARLRLLIPSKAENPMQIRAAVLSQMEQPRPYAQTRPIAIETVNLAGPGPNEPTPRDPNSSGPRAVGDLLLVAGNGQLDRRAR